MEFTRLDQIAAVSASSTELRLIALPVPEMLTAIHALAANPAVSEHMEWPAHQTMTDTAAFFEQCALDAQTGNGIHLAIVNNGIVVGVTSLVGIQRERRTAEVATWLGKDYWGRGLNRQAKRMTFAFAFGPLALVELSFRVAVGNSRSIASHEHLGTRRHGILRSELSIRGRHVDAILFVLSVEDYARQHPLPIVIHFEKTTT
jgi:ribosomal-protein-alanine N-acetyltransferase